ncbi:hypothetical protein M5K25_016514 [Dendrobium thyrsiflorum]|uniref:Uncharacterized protein n=1 Tax=Dendrobium thyrsiflorum TaxID=117978 RepID=A0ABD0UKF1_DENTH
MLLLRRGGKGIRCDVYDEMGKTPFSALVSNWKTNSCTLFSSVVPEGPMQAILWRGCDTCPLTGGFAAKWHRRINGYDSGPSELGDSPPNGITILRLWPMPVCSPMASNP